MTMYIKKIRLLFAGFLAFGASLTFAEAIAATNVTAVSEGTTNEVVEALVTNVIDGVVVTNVVDEVAASNAVIRALANLRIAFLQEERTLAEALDEDFKEKYPVYKRGDELSVTRPNGIVAGGTLASATKSYVVLKQGNFESKLAFKELQVGDRLRLDRKFRETWIEMESRTSARAALQEQGETFPQFSLGIKVQLKQALEYADPDACYLMAESYRTGLREEKDNAYVFLYNFMAAKQGHVDGRYDLGRMYYGAISVLRNKRTGLQLIASAGADGHEKAGAFLAKHKVSAAAMKEAAAAYQEQQRKEAEVHAAQVQRFELMNKNRKVDRSRHDFKIGN